MPKLECFSPSEISNPDQALPWVIKNLLPPGLAGLVFVAFIAALHSSVDSTLNSASTICTKDIYQRYFRKRASDRHYLLVGRILTGFFVVFGVLFAPITDRFPGIYVAMQNLLSFFQGPTLATLLLGILWWRSTRWGGFFGLTGGVVLLSAIFPPTKIGKIVDMLAGGLLVLMGSLFVFLNRRFKK